MLIYFTTDRKAVGGSINTMSKGPVSPHFALAIFSIVPIS